MGSNECPVVSTTAVCPPGSQASIIRSQVSFRSLGTATDEWYIAAEVCIREANAMKRALMTTICFVLLTSMTVAQSVDGNWTTGLHARGPDGQIITLTLKSDGSKVTGTVYGI